MQTIIVMLVQDGLLLLISLTCGGNAAILPSIQVNRLYSVKLYGNDLSNKKKQRNKLSGSVTIMLVSMKIYDLDSYKKGEYLALTIITGGLGSFSRSRSTKIRENIQELVKLNQIAAQEMAVSKLPLLPSRYSSPISKSEGHSYAPAHLPTLKNFPQSRPHFTQSLLPHASLRRFRIAVRLFYTSRHFNLTAP